MTAKFIRIDGENEDKIVMATLALQLDLALGMLARGGLTSDTERPGPIKLGLWQIEQVRTLLREQAGPNTRTTLTTIEPVPGSCPHDPDDECDDPRPPTVIR